jgi:Ca2+-binding RTX toxin-like protein
MLSLLVVDSPVQDFELRLSESVDDAVAPGNNTGSAEVGGDLAVEISTGPIEAVIPFAGEVLEEYSYTLDDAVISTSNALVNNLGGAAGFGENVLPVNDDGSTLAIDITSVFGPDGLDFFGIDRTFLYINNNGNITFASSLSSYTPSFITGSGNPIIAAFWADVDTRGQGALPTPGGNSMGTNRVYYDLDAENQVFTVTWDDVGYYSSATNLLNAFQLQLVDRGGGNFDIVLRYESINWTTGTASGGSGGLGGTVARMGYSAGNGADYFELPASGNQSAVLALDSTPGNTGHNGVYIFSVQNGEVVPALSIAPANADRLEGNAGATPFTFTITRIGDTSGSTTVDWSVHASATSPSADAADFGGEFPAGRVTFAAGETAKVITVNVTGDTLYESAGLTEGFIVTLANASGGAAVIAEAADGRIQNDDAALPTGPVNVVGTPGNDILNGGASDDTLTGLAGNDILDGLDGDDLVDAGDGNDTLNGGEGDDTLTGGGGIDTLNGGTGTDTVDYSTAPGAVVVDLVAGTAAGASGNDVLTGIENIRGSAFADRLTGNANPNVIEGSGGNATLNGGAGNDTLDGSAGDDTLNGGEASIPCPTPTKPIR